MLRYPFVHSVFNNFTKTSFLTILGIIPSRYNSIRFPGKPLAVIKGKSMIQRVYEQASKSKTLKKVVVATDDERIYNHVKEFGGHVEMTSAEHKSGTERCAEALSLVDGEYDGVINIQGDEPFIQPDQIDKVACALEEGADITTLVKRIRSMEDYENTSVVKVTRDVQSEKVWFSRKLSFSKKILSDKDFLNKVVIHKHIGIYGYKASVLKAIVSLSPSPLEKLHSLEQLRWLENGYTIKVKETHFETQAVDTPEDLEKLRV